MVSSIKPIQPIEFTFPLFPPSTPFTEWLSRATISPWMRWDAVWYQQIVTSGYSAENGTAQFHPLYPWLAKLLSYTGISPSLSLLVVSSVSGIALFYFFYKLAKIDLPQKDAMFALLLFAFAPPAFILFAPYSEAIFILLAVLCLYFSLRRVWWAAGITGGLAALTRQQGIFLMLPMGWELWEAAGRSVINVRKCWKDWLPLVFIPLGMLIWLVYRALFLNDLNVTFSNIHRFIYSLLISPSSTKVVPEQQFVWPWLAVKNSIDVLISHPDIDIWVNLIAAVFFIVILAFSWTRMRISYRLYSLVITMVAFSYSTGSVHPYMGLPRHLFLAFPVFIGLAALIKNPIARVFIIGASAVAMAFLIVLYVLLTWVP
jgi:Gpi18-like mannosyltransferase